MIASATVTLLAISMPTATAHAPYTVDGWAAPHNDWNEEHRVGSCVNYSSFTVGTMIELWQLIFYADGTGSLTNVDGVWGPVTDGDAMEWEALNGLVQDGCMGPSTWKKADNGIEPSTNVCQDPYPFPDVWRCSNTYVGLFWDFPLYRQLANQSGNWWEDRMIYRLAQPANEIIQAPPCHC